MQRAIKLVGLALLYVLAFIIVEAIGAMHPYMWTYSAVPAALVAAWPYYKLCERYPLPGMAMLCALMLLMFNFLFGQGHEIFALGCIILGFIAEGCRKFIGNYRSRKGTIISYAVMSLIPFTKTCVMWIEWNTAKEILMFNKLPWYKGMWLDIHYASFGRMLSFSTLILMIIITIVFAIIAMYILTRKWNPREEYHIIH